MRVNLRNLTKANNTAQYRYIWVNNTKQKLDLRNIQFFDYWTLVVIIGTSVPNYHFLYDAILKILHSYALLIMKSGRINIFHITIGICQMYQKVFKFMSYLSWMLILNINKRTADKSSVFNDLRSMMRIFFCSPECLDWYQSSCFIRGKSMYLMWNGGLSLNSSYLYSTLSS